MKFSVIIPLYNKAPYVNKALESVFAQTYTDFELIIVDDGSTDDSAAIAKQCITDRCTVDRHDSCRSALPVEIIEQANSGVSAARNNGVAASSGDYIAFLDADDWWEPTYLEKMTKLIEDYPEAGLYASNYYYHKDGQNIIKVDIPTGYFNYPKEYFKNFAMPVWTGATMIPRQMYDKMGGFPLGIKLGEDFLLWAKIALSYPVAFLNEPLAYYNNTLPPRYRATYSLHKPEQHMLFRLELLNSSHLSPLTSHLTNDDWRRLLDMLRLLGLHNYWLSNEYYELAQQELDKVDMSQQYAFLVRMYRQSRWVQKLKQRFLYLASGPISIMKRLKQKKKTNQVNTIINNTEYRKSIGLPL